MYRSKRYLGLGITMMILLGSSCGQNFQEQILESQGRAYVALQVKHGSQVGTIVATWGTLEVELDTSIGSDGYTFLDSLFRHIEVGSALPVSDAEWVQLEPFIVDRDPEVDRIRSKGKRYFLNHYFDGQGILRKVAEGNEVGYLIKVLFDERIIVGSDDLTGRPLLLK